MPEQAVSASAPTRGARAAVEEFLGRLRDTPISVERLRAFLDALDHEDRVAAIRAAGRSEQRRLYAAVDGFAPVGLLDLVPAGRPAEQAVRHFGRNTLPAFTHFEKRFCRPSEQAAGAPTELWGFNFQALRPLTGPGYFVARPSPRPGEVAIDYRSVPPRAPAGWPAVKRNETGVSRFVYGFMVDTLRRVSEHVTIGSAARRGRDLGSWFLLTREP